MSPERSTKTPFQLIDLLEASEEELRTLADKIQAKSGFLQVLVHPFYDDGVRFSTQYENYKIRRDRFISACLNHNIPLVIFEEEDKLDTLKDRLPKDISCPIFVVMTESTTPVPYGNHDMNSVIQLLRKIRAKKVCVGGQYMYVGRMVNSKEPYPGLYDKLRWTREANKVPCRWIDASISPYGCAGGVAVDLYLERFQVVLSFTSYPENMSRFVK